MTLSQVTSSGLTTVIGGAGRDVLTVVAAGPGGTFTAPNLTLANWTTSTDPDTRSADVDDEQYRQALLDGAAALPKPAQRQ